MRRASATAIALCVAACAHAPASQLALITSLPTISGDFDGDGGPDTASFFENAEGALLVGVLRAASSGLDELWGGDISSLPRFTFRAVPAGLYQTNCEAYGPNCGGAPAEVLLTHDGIIVEGLEDHSRTLYYWADGTFKNVSVLE